LSTDELSPLKKALLAVQKLKGRLHDLSHGPIAIVGAGLRLPGGVVDLESYRSLLYGGVDAVSEVPPDRWDVDAWYDADGAPGKMITREAGFLDEVARFDAGFFGISPREALEMDPAQRLLLVTAWEALEAAGIAPDSLSRTRTGVYVGLGLSDYGRRHFLGPDPTRLTAYSGTGSFLSVAAGRVSYSLGLQGPAVTVDTACSSSLVSIHLAVQSLRRGETDVALAGGANLILSPEPTVYFSQLDAMAPDGRCKTFDARADGYVRGEGAGMVALKRLADAVADGDPILAVIRGTAVNQDGRSNGLTAPSGRAQQQVIREALADAGLTPEQIGAIEAHGTGTPLGDPIEVDALAAVFGGRDTDAPIHLSSAKTNLGHTETAAGVTGLLKLALQIHDGRIAPHLHLQQVNPRIRLEGTPLSIPTEPMDWEASERLGGVSSFGLSGTNAHLILGPAPAPPDEAAETSAHPVELVPLSARGAAARAALADRWSASLGGSLNDIAYSAAIGRAALPDRLAVAARSTDEARARLAAFARGEEPAGVVHGTVRGSVAPAVGFLFTGQGSQVDGMGKGLYDAEPAFAEAFDAAIDAAAPHLDGVDLRAVMWEGDDRLHDTRYTQPALFALQTALVALWRSWGVEPDALIGHSIGEYAAAWAAGVFSLADGMQLVCARGRLMSELPRDGGMLAIFAPEDQVAAEVARHDGVDISGINNPTETVVSGRTDGIDALQAHFEAAEVKCRRLRVSHAFHSPLMEPILDAFEQVAAGLSLSAADRPVVSNLDGREVQAELADPAYWRRHVRQAVRFADGMATLNDQGLRLFVEIGPRPILSGMGARCFGDVEATWLPSLHPDHDDAEQVVQALGGLWAHGAHVDLTRRSQGRRVPLPTYVWQEETYWLEPVPGAGPADPYADLALEVAWRPAVASPSEPRGRWSVRGPTAWAEALAARGAHVADGDADHVLVVADGPCDVLDAAQQLGDATLHVVLRPSDEPRDALDRAAAAGLAAVVGLERAGQLGAVVKVQGDSSSDAVLDAVLTDDGEVRQLVRDGRRRVARLAGSRKALGPTPELGDAWVVTGGFGSLGRRVARWLADQGATTLLLTGRSGASTQQAKALVQELEARGVAVVEGRGDVTDPGSLERMLAAVDAPIRGAVHCAGINDDAPLAEQTRDRVEAVLAPKAIGGWNLHQQLPDDAMLVLFGSASGTLGVPGQANYAAANAALDELARLRRQAGKPALSIAWGPWADSTMVDELGADVEALWAREGIRTLDPEEALALLGRALGGTAPAVLAADFDWEAYAASRPTPDPLYDEIRPAVREIEAATSAGPALVEALRDAPEGARAGMLRDHVQQVVGTVLGFGPGRSLGLEEGFFDAGLDSLMAVDLRNRLQRATGATLSATVAFDHPDVRSLADHLLAELQLGGVADRAVVGARHEGEAIAVVGAACRLPGGVVDLDTLWDLVSTGGDGIVEVPKSRFDVDRYFDPEPGTPGRTYCRHGGFVDDIDQFDPTFFGISPREAVSLDPQQRMLLECSWHALDDAGLPADRLRETPTGVYVGIGQSEYWHRFDPTDPGDVVDAYSGTGNETSFAAGRISYVLGLRGPAMAVNTACSSSLVSLQMAVEGLRAGACDLALAGGVNAIVGPETTLWMSMLQALAPDGHCKAFDARADGYVRSEGCGMLALKRLADAQRDGDRIHAVIRGAAVNHDGPSSGLTVPNGTAQQQVIRAALADGGVRPEDVGLIECHGTGTKLGDPIEVGALGKVLADGRAADRPLYLGAAKANLGHLEAGAGIAGVLKAIASLKHQAIAPLAGLQSPNPDLPLGRYPSVRLPTALEPWPSDGPRIAGVSSFGISGTNAHVLLEEAPARPVVSDATDRPAHLLLVSGRTEAAARQQAEVLRTALDDDLRLADVAYTLSHRAHLPHRLALVAADRAEARAALEQASQGQAPVSDRAGDPPRLVFLCTGAGPQCVGMARELYDGSDVFRAALDECARLLEPHLDRPLLEVIYPPAGEEDASPINELAYTQPAMFAIEWAMAQLWKSWGVEPDAVIGHSTGQYIAACLAGVYDLATGLQLMATRARLMSDQPRIGSMVAVMAPEATVRTYLEGHADQVDIAAVNGPAEAVISGLSEPVNAIADRIEADGIEIRRLRISHAAHSPLMEPVLPELERVVGAAELSAPRIPLVENVRGEVAGDELLTTAYWARHMRHGVKFAAGMRTLADLGYRHFLEIGNHPILSGAGARTLEDLDDTLFVPSIRRKNPEWRQLLEGVGRLHAAGVAIDWDGFHAEAPGQRIGLPGTVFQKKRYWVERTDAASQRTVGHDWTYGETWQPVRLNVDAFGARASGTLVVLADRGGLGARLAERQERPTVVIGPDEVDPADTEALAARIAAAEPATIACLWALDAPKLADGADAHGIDPVDAASLGVQGALAALRAAGDASVVVATRGAVSTGGEAPSLAQSPVTGLLTVAAMELPDTPVVGIDLEDGGDDLMSLELVLNAGLVEEQLAFRDGQPLGRRLTRVDADPGHAPAIRDDATYLVTGGLGALGLRTARWLREQGAGGIVLTSRSAPSDDAQQVVEQTGAVVLRADVGQAEAVAQLIADIDDHEQLPPLAGVFHAAGVLDDGALRNLDWPRFAGVWGPKVRGSWNLHRQAGDLALFVLFSSAAGFVGSAGQANYAAGNRFMDALATARRAADRHAVSLAWGPWGDSGLATEAKRQWTAGGVTPLPPHQGMAVMGQLLGSPTPVVAIADLDWEAWPRSLPRVPQLVQPLVIRPEPTDAAPALVAAVRDVPESRRDDALADGIAAVVGAVLGLDPSELDHTTGFFDQGLDSLMAVEVANRLKIATGLKLPATVAFDHPTVAELRDHLRGALDLGGSTAPEAVQVVHQPVELDEPIAVIGVSCRMPGGANDPEAFWELLRSGDDPMEVVPAERWDIDRFYDPTPATPGKMYVRDAGWVDWSEVQGFDPEFFGISPREAASMDPQQRMLLEVSYEALERAGVATADLSESQTGVFVGVGDSGYLQRFQEAGGELYADTYAGTGNLSAFVSGRVAYVLGVHGPNLALNTACSSSLVATHLACQALRTGDADIALAGGVHLMLSPENFVYVSQLKALASDGRCKTFDASANGYGRSEGCGMLVLKRLSDAQRDGDPVIALIRGTAVNHDGPSSGLTVPHGPAQVQVLGKAVGRSGIDPLDVSYIECHGTGTVLGDPIEVHAIEEVYAQGRTEDRPLYLGAVKANVGHMEVAAGAASMVKMALAFEHGELPPQAHFHEPNPDLDLGGRLQVLTEPMAWHPEAGRRVAGVSAFGLAGTNVHVVMEEAPPAPEPVRVDPDDERPSHLLALSARSPGALRDLAVRYGALLKDGASLPDVAFSAHTTRNHFPHRLAVAGATCDDVARRLASFVAHGEASQLVSDVARGRPPRVVFLFSGQGSQYPGMGAELYDAHPVFRDVIDRCAAAIDDRLEVPLKEVMFADPKGDRAELITDTTYTQPCLFALEVALAELWKSWGVQPAAVIGHSIGQLTAACIAGVFSIEDGLKLVAERGRLMGSLPRDGAMAALFAEGEVVEAAMAPHGDAIGVAARNNPGETVVSGRTEAVEAVVAALEEQGIEGRMLKVSHAFHSPLMEPILDDFEAAAAQVSFHPPQIDVICNLSGAVATAEQLTSPAYWRSLIREGVMFADGLRTLDEEGYDTFVEVGPHTALLGMGKRTVPDRSLAWLASLKRREDPWSMILPSLGALYARGVAVDWRGFDGPWPRNRVGLPTYPWQHRVTWMDKPEWPQLRDEARGWLVEEVWRPVPVPQAVPLVGYWVVVGDGADADLATRALREAGATVEPDGDWGGATGVVVVAGDDPVKNTETALEVTHALADHGGQLVLLTRGAHRCGTEVTQPAHATLLGFGRVVALEAAALRPLRIDLDPGADSEAEAEAEALAQVLMASDDEHELEVALRDEGTRYVRRLTPGRFAADATPIRPDGCYLITGGLGGLGLQLARWLADQGATQLVLTGRSAPKPHAEEVMAELAEAGCEVTVARGDVGVADDVTRIISELPGPLRGVIHAAGVIDDAALLRQTAESVRKVANPKVQGTLNLHHATAELDLDLFVLFSGGASLLGSPGQANYSAANAFLDAFASWRSAQGLPALAIQWGAWAEVGMAASLGEAHKERQASEGIHRLPLREGMDAMGRLLGNEVPVMGVLNVDWATFVATVHRGDAPPLLQELVPAHREVAAAAAPAEAPAPAPVAASGLPPLIDAVVNHPREAWNEEIEAIVHDLALSVLGLDRDRQLDHTQPLLESGLDSLLAVELKNRIMDHGVDVPVARVMTGPSIAQVAQMVVNVVEEQGLAELPEEAVPTEHGKAPRPVGDPRNPTAAAEAVQQAGWVPPPRPMEGGSGIGINTVIVAFMLGCLVPVVAYVGTLFAVGPEEANLQNTRTEMPAPEPVEDDAPKSKSKGKSKGKRK